MSVALRTLVAGAALATLTGCGGRVTLVESVPGSDAAEDALVSFSDAGSSDAAAIRDSGQSAWDSAPPEDSGLSCEELYECASIDPTIFCGECSGIGLMMTVDCDAFDELVLPLLAEEPVTWLCSGNYPDDSHACAGAAEDWFCYTMTSPYPPSWLSPELHQILCDLAAQGLAMVGCQFTG